MHAPPWRRVLVWPQRCPARSEVLAYRRRHGMDMGSGADMNMDVNMDVNMDMTGHGMKSRDPEIDMRVVNPHVI